MRGLGLGAAAAVGALTATALYTVTLGYGFVFDDLHQIVGNPWVESPAGVREAFTHGVWDFEGRRSSYYRPAMYLVYASVRGAIGPNPWGFHLANVLLHAAASAVAAVLAGTLLARGFPGRREASVLPALAVGVLFATHPAHVEPVAWCAGVADLGMGLFFLLSLLLFVLSRDRFSAAYLAALSAFGAALLFKEPAATLPVALVVYDALFLVPARGWRRTAGRLAPFLAVLAGYLLLRRAVIGGVAPTIRASGLSALDHVLAVLDLLTRHLGTLVLPVDLNVWHVVSPPASIVSARGLLSVGAAVGLAAVGVQAWRRRSLAAFALSVAVLPLLPSFVLGALNQDRTAAFAERYLYLPAFGFLLLVVTGLLALGENWPDVRRATTAAPLVLALAYVLGSIHRIPVWEDSLSLWSDAARKSPQSALARANLGFALLYAGRAEEGKAELSRARDLDPTLAHAWVAKGIDYARHGFSAKAILALHTALALEPNLAEAYFNLGVLYDAQGAPGNAIAAYERAVALKPEDVAARNNLAIAYAESGRMNDARRQLQEAARLAPEDAEIRANLERARADGRAP